MGCAGDWSVEELSLSRLGKGRPSDMQDKGRGPASYPTPYYPAPGICFVPVRHRLPPSHTRMLGEGARYTGGVIGLQLCKCLLCPFYTDLTM